MKLITRDTDYAVRALVFIAQHPNKTISVVELVDELKIPRTFLRKILQALNKNGILKSFKGLGGGFRLAILPKNILLVDLMGVFQGPLEINECIFKRKICPNKNTCSLRSKINNIEKYVIKQLKTININSLL